MAQTEPSGTPAPRYLIAAAVLTAVTLAAVGIDVVVGDVQVPPPVLGLVRAAAVGCWIVWYVAARLDRIDQHFSQNRWEDADWLDGYVHGVSRRTPPPERVRFFGD